MIFITFLTAIALSAVAAYYSVIGLASIFPGSFWPVVLMGAVLESSKLVTVSWLYRNWTRAPFLMKTYMSIAVTILMLITSMGIFGYLSKAHLEHSSDTSPLQSRVELLQEKIRVERETIEESRKELKQLDSIVEQTVGRSTDEKGLIQAQALRRTQQKDRGRLVSQIEQSQSRIASNQEELAPLSVEFKKAEADLGPIKYVAALAYGEEAGVGAVEKAVRLVIGLIIVVFDPLAILLLIAANVSMQNKHEVKFVKEEPIEPSQPVGLVAQEIESVLPEVLTSAEQAERYTVDYNNLNSMMIKAIQELQENKQGVDKFAYLKQPFKHFENTKPMVAPKQEVEPVVEKKQDNVEIHKDNLIVIDDLGNSIPPITATKYDYDANYAFTEKPKKLIDGGNF
jgi:hypothetical protein